MQDFRDFIQSYSVNEENFWEISVGLGLPCLDETKQMLERERGPERPSAIFDDFSIMSAQKEQEGNRLCL